MNGTSSTKVAKLGGSKEWGKKARKAEARTTRTSTKAMILKDQKENG